MDVSSKLLFSTIKRGIEEHLVNSKLVLDNQIGFTEGGRTEYCHFILQYLVEKTFNSNRNYHKNLVIVALDFKKAFDSIDRRRMVETLVKYKIHPHIINLIANIYSKDETIVRMGDREENMKVTAGIKQGCTASTVLFKIITFEIMRRLDEEGESFEIDKIKINSIFFADDSILIGNSIEKARRNIRIVKEISSFFGLEINEKKSQILIYKGKYEEREIEGIKIMDKIKYLGMNICNKKDIFKLQKKDIIDRAKWRMKGTFSVIEKSCNRVMVGNT